MKEKFILLGFDVEEFDVPLEYGQLIPEQQQMEQSLEGLIKIEDLLQRLQVPATFFTTANFALKYPAVIQRLAATHEIASHTFYHSKFQDSDLLDSRLELERITGRKITGLRMPRMNVLPEKLVKEAGYLYDSSLHPTWIPGKYNHFGRPRKYYFQEELLCIPASVSPFLRIPLFWLSFKNFPFAIYKRLSLQALRRYGYLVLYFHPWEFTSLDCYRIPRYVRKPDGDPLLKRLEKLLFFLKSKGRFITMDEFRCIASRN